VFIDGIEIAKGAIVVALGVSVDGTKVPCSCGSGDSLRWVPICSRSANRSTTSVRASWVAAHFPEECRHILETLGNVYHNDAIAKERKMSPDERFARHIANSGPLTEELEKQMKARVDEKNVKPNSGLGEAIAYM
jgi:hypothetical protein